MMWLQLWLPPIQYRETWNPPQRPLIAGDQGTLMFESGFGDHEVGIVIRVTVLTREYPQIRRSIPNRVRHGQNQRVLAENGEIRQLTCRSLLLVAAEHFIPGDG